ncbi:MAG: hypothetical protein LBO07_03355 [Coriobacteriales bacterium]|nr:hypothetical protein [Coriobacteriales bacterium]
MIHTGEIERLKVGYYISAESLTDVSDTEIAAALVPFGAVCLWSAAQFYGLTTINPLAVTIAIPANRTRVALPKHPPIELVAYPLSTFELGITSVKEGQTAFRIYDRERTVCDFFRKRGRLGEDVALDVLREYMRGARNLQRLFDYAGKLHINAVIRPYVEALA